MNLQKIIISNKSEHKEFKIPFKYSDLSDFTHYLKYLIELKKNISIKMYYDNGEVKEENILCETN